MTLTLITQVRPLGHSHYFSPAGYYVRVSQTSTIGWAGWLNGILTHLRKWTAEYASIEYWMCLRFAGYQCCNSTLFGDSFRTPHCTPLVSWKSANSFLSLRPYHFPQFIFEYLDHYCLSSFHVKYIIIITSSSFTCPNNTRFIIQICHLPCPSCIFVKCLGEYWYTE